MITCEVCEAQYVEEEEVFCPICERKLCPYCATFVDGICFDCQENERPTEAQE